MESVDHTAKALFDFVLAITSNLKGLEHDLGLVVPDRARHQLVAVASKVILIAEHLQRVAIERVHAALGHRERVVLKVNLAALIIFLIDREINDPAEGKAVFVCQAKLFADHVAGAPCNSLKSFRLAAKEERRIADAKAELLTDRFSALRTDIFGEGACSFHAFALITPEDIAHTRQTLFLGKSVHTVTEFTAAACRCRDRADLCTILLQKLCKDRKTRAFKVLGGILHLDRVAQIGLVGAIPFGRIAVADLRPFAVYFLAATKLFKHALHDRLDRIKDVLLLHKAHLKVKLVEVCRRTVGTRVFVAEARRNLEIFVKARHHDQLFELLWRLRQSVEFTRVQAARHEKVARAFGA